MNIFFDIETDSLDPTVIHCVCMRSDNGHEQSYVHPVNFSRALTFLNNANIIGHNILGFDLPVLQKLWGINYCIEPDIFGDTKCTIIDTLVWSRYLYPDRPGGHSLETWGERLGHPKMEHKDFATYTPEMLEYCKNDVLLTEKVYNYLLTKEMNP
mgnify:CR=1 FL=1